MTTPTTAGPGASPSTDASAGELVRQLSEQVSVLVRDELKLAQLELTRKGKQAGIGVGLLGSSGLIALYGVACLLAAAIIALSGVLRPWLAALIVGAALLAAAGLSALLGTGRLRKATPPVPQEAIADVKADVTEIKEGIRR
jgi:membrane protein